MNTNRFPAPLPLLVIILSFAWALPSWSQDTLRVGVLKFGTVNWTLEVIQRLELDRKHGFKLEVLPLAGKNATHVAIQGGAANMIVTDWLWVSRQRAAQQDYTFAPYSTASGSIMVRPDSGVTTLADLSGKRLGVAGGPVDKSWLMFSAYTLKTLGKPADELVEANFAAPPLINELMLRDEIPAALNFWHYSARLEAAGMTPLMPVRDILPALGIAREIPLIGWVFHESWAGEHPEVVAGFLAAAEEAQQRMKTDDALWDDIRPLLQAENGTVALKLRDEFRLGVIDCFDDASVDAITRAFEVLAQTGGAEVVGDNTALSDGTIWPAAIGPGCG